MSKNKKAVKHHLGRLQVRPRKERGQNFVIEPFVIEEIVAYGRFSPKNQVIEIGPGLGALTAELSRASSLCLIEIEPKFATALASLYPHARVINADVREVKFDEIGDGPFTVFGNLPYSFSTDILFHLIDQSHVISRATLLLQKEFAARVAAGPGSRTYGVLSIMVQLWASVDLGSIIPGTAFHPPTKVDSQILSLDFRSEPLIDRELLDLFGWVVRLAFLQRRKKISNSLDACGHFEADHLTYAFNESGVSPDLRPESISIKEFESFVRALKKVIT
jgi:16S rRNA (adenine1518-N6/adenine1519-N6)-dimethyltransferase